MREIKFRYVYKHKKTGEIKSEIYTLDDIQGYEDDNASEWLAWREWDIIAREQFTGLKDKTGKEIYEGDVVKRDFRVFLNGKLKDSDIRYITVTIPEIYFDLKGSIEIISNIHEKDEIPY